MTAKESIVAEPDAYVVEAYGLRVGKDPSLLNSLAPEFSFKF
jgi:hypothetical protein